MAWPDTDDDHVYREAEIDRKIRDLNGVMDHSDPDLSHLVDEDERIRRDGVVREKLREIAKLYDEDERLRWSGDRR